MTDLGSVHPTIRRSRRGRTGGGARAAGLQPRHRQKQAMGIDFASRYGICNPLYGVQMVFSEEMKDASAAPSTTGGLVKEWLDKGCAAACRSWIPNQRGSRNRSPRRALRKDPRFVTGADALRDDMPLGKRAYWRSMPPQSGLGLGASSSASMRQRLSQPRPRSAGVLTMFEDTSPQRRRSRPVDQPDRRRRLCRHPKLKMVMWSRASPGCRHICGG